MPKKIYLTEDQLLYIKISYTGERGSAVRIAEALKLRPAHVRVLANRMGLTRNGRVKNSVWTQEKDSQLKDWFFKDPIQIVARRLHVSITAARSRAYKLGLCSSKSRDGWYTATEFAGVLGLNRRTLVQFIEDETLEVTFDRLPGEGNKPIYRITRKAARKFIMSHLSYLTGRNVDLLQLVEIITRNGVEYKGEVNG